MERQPLVGMAAYSKGFGAVHSVFRRIAVVRQILAKIAVTPITARPTVLGSGMPDTVNVRLTWSKRSSEV
jgi:hypothetical protein